MKSYFLRSAASRGARRAVSFSTRKSAASLSRSKSGVQKSASQRQLGKKPSATGRRRPGRSSPIWNCFSVSRTCKYFAAVTTLLLLTGAIAMVVLYFQKQKKIMTDKPNAMAAIREFMLLQNESYKGKSDSEILEGVLHLARSLSQLKSRNDHIEKATNDIIARLVEGWKPFSGSLYYFSVTTLRAMEADEACEQQGGRLVIINSRAEEEYLENEVAKRDSPFYIGLIKVGDLWKWVNTQLLTTSYWGEREVGVEGPCAVIFKCRVKGKCWNNVPCTDYRKWICKVKPDPQFL